MFNSSAFVSPFTVSINDGFEEINYDNIFDAVSHAEGIAEEGGYADIFDATGAEVPLFVEWYDPAESITLSRNNHSCVCPAWGIPSVYEDILVSL